MKKYRVGKIKREHTVIEKVWSVLEEMAACEVIASIIPGPISPLHTTGFEITYQRMTETGLRLLAKNGSAVQEIYVVTAEKERALAWLAERGIIDWKPIRHAQPDRPATAGVKRKTVTIPSDFSCEVCGKLITAGTRAVILGSRHYTYVHIRCAK